MKGLSWWSWIGSSERRRPVDGRKARGGNGRPAIGQEWRQGMMRGAMVSRAPGICALLTATWPDGRPVVSGAAPGGPAVHFLSQKRASQKP